MKIFKIIFRRLVGNLSYAKIMGMKVGQGVTVMGNVNFGSEPYLITLEDNVRISFNVSFINHDGGTWVFRHLDKYKEVTSFGKIYVGKNTFIGANSTILPNVKIGSYCIIGAGAIVTKSIPDYSIAVGIPAKIIGNIENYKEKLKQNMPNDWNQSYYKKNKKAYLLKSIKNPTIKG